MVKEKGKKAFVCSDGFSYFNHSIFNSMEFYVGVLTAVCSLGVDTPTKNRYKNTAKQAVQG